MALVFRFGIIAIALGFILGFILRTVLNPSQRVWLIILSLFAPLIHGLYVMNRASVRLGSSLPQSLWFIIICLVLSLIFAVLAFRVYRIRPSNSYTLPLLWSLLYSGVFFWIYEVYRVANVIFDSLPNIVLAFVMLFLSALVWALSFRRQPTALTSASSEDT